MAQKDVPTVNINNKNYNTFTGFTIQNGHNQFDIKNGSTGNIVQHCQNHRWTAQHLSVRLIPIQTLVRNNEITLNHNYSDMGHPINTSELEYFVYIWHRKSMIIHQKYLSYL